MPTVIMHDPPQEQLDAWDASKERADWDLYDEAYTLIEELEAGNHKRHLRQNARLGGMFVVPFGRHRDCLLVWKWATYPDTIEVHEIRQVPGAGQQ